MDRLRRVQLPAVGVREDRRHARAGPVLLGNVPLRRDRAEGGPSGDRPGARALPPGGAPARPGKRGGVPLHPRGDGGGGVRAVEGHRVFRGVRRRRGSRPLVLHEGVPEAAGAHLHEPRARPAGGGVPRDPVEDRGWGRAGSSERGICRDPGVAPLPSGAAYRFRLRRLLRGVGVPRFPPAARPVSCCWSTASFSSPPGRRTGSRRLPAGESRSSS